MSKQIKIILNFWLKHEVLEHNGLSLKFHKKGVHLVTQNFGNLNGKQGNKLYWKFYN